MGSFHNYLTTKLGKLVIAAIQSPNFVSGSAGWRIAKDGTAEFNSGTFRGTITITQADGTILQINDEYITYYDSTGANVLGQIALFNGILALFGPSHTNVSALYLPSDSLASIVSPGPVVASEPGSSADVPEGWHDIGVSLSGWANTSSSPPLQCRLLASGEVRLIGDVSGTAITASPAILGTPSGSYSRSGHYLIAAPVVIASGTITSGQDSPMVQINSSGQIALYNCKGATRIIINYTYPLDYNLT